MKTYSGNSDRVHVTGTNEDYILCPSCTADESTVYAGASGKKWRKFIPSGGGAGTGDVTSNTILSVENELPLFTGTTGKVIKRATGSGYVKTASGVTSFVALINAGTDLTGTLPDGILSANVPLKNTTNTYTGTLDDFQGYRTTAPRVLIGPTIALQPVSVSRTIIGSNLKWDGTNIRYLQTGFGGYAEFVNGALNIYGVASGSSGAIASPTTLMELPLATAPRFENMGGTGTEVVTANATGVFGRSTLLTTANVGTQIKDSLDRNATYLRNPVTVTHDTLVKRFNDSTIIIAGIRFVAGSGISIAKVNSGDTLYQYTITNTGGGGGYTPGLAKQVPNANYTIDLVTDDFISLPEPTTARTLTLPAASTAPGKIIRIYNRSDFISDWILSGSYIQDGSTATTEDFVNSALKLGTTTWVSMEISSGVYKWQEIK
jgi:hypothetical protein